VRALDQVQDLARLFDRLSSMATKAERNTAATMARRRIKGLPVLHRSVHRGRREG
jgi:hypothetical protein